MGLCRAPGGAISSLDGAISIAKWGYFVLGWGYFVHRWGYIVQMGLFRPRWGHMGPIWGYIVTRWGYFEPRCAQPRALTLRQPWALNQLVTKHWKHIALSMRAIPYLPGQRQESMGANP